MRILCVCVCFVCVLKKFRIHIETCYSSRFTVSLFLTLPENANPGEIELEQRNREDFGNTHIYKELFVHFFFVRHSVCMRKTNYSGIVLPFIWFLFEWIKLIRIHLWDVNNALRSSPLFPSLAFVAIRLAFFFVFCCALPHWECFIRLTFIPYEMQRNQHRYTGTQRSIQL